MAPSLSRKLSASVSAAVLGGARPSASFAAPHSAPTPPRRPWTPRPRASQPAARPGLTAASRAPQPPPAAPAQAPATWTAPPPYDADAASARSHRTFTDASCRSAPRRPDSTDRQTGVRLPATATARTGATAAMAPPLPC
ncbi:lysine-rich arabinogalactan protein 19-like [Schistocerca americana]|uniref:lysine-rich arabinogalactan protein 19-like n=1 Tax=Schistocerca americana TaxID=7009 RepID=UPI001F4F4AF3|nr:lysine-rich arabinogalactan protein 19-like [Schistocerca americana]